MARDTSMDFSTSAKVSFEMGTEVQPPLLFSRAMSLPARRGLMRASIRNISENAASEALTPASRESAIIVMVMMVPSMGRLKVKSSPL